LGPLGGNILKTLKINTSDTLCLLKITQLTPRNEHTVAAPSEQHLTFKCAECKNTVSLNFDFSSSSQIFTFNMSAYSVTLFSFTRGRHAHKFEIFTITVTSSSRMRVIYHNWSATKQRPHPQSVAEISHHSVLSGDRIRQCETSSGSRHKDTDQCL